MSNQSPRHHTKRAYHAALNQSLQVCAKHLCGRCGRCVLLAQYVDTMLLHRDAQTYSAKHTPHGNVKVARLSLSRRTTLALFVPNGLLIIRSLACVAGWGSGDLTRALTLAQHMIYGRIDLRAGSRERRRLTFAEAGDGFVAVNGHE